MGYQLLWANKNKESIGVFRLVAWLFPDSFNAFDCLAEAYQQKGNYELAIINYRKSLDLNSANSNAVQHLSQLKQLKLGT